jgi:hypothetical protein
MAYKAAAIPTALLKQDFEPVTGLIFDKNYDFDSQRFKSEGFDEDKTIRPQSSASFLFPSASLPSMGRAREGCNPAPSPPTLPPFGRGDR